MVKLNGQIDWSSALYKPGTGRLRVQAGGGSPEAHQTRSAGQTETGQKEAGQTETGQKEAGQTETGQTGLLKGRLAT